MIAVFSALEPEIINLKKRMLIKNTFEHNGSRFYEGKYGSKEGILVVTGMGKQKAIRAAEHALNNYPVRVMISTGMSGGLDERTLAGDFIIAPILKSDTEDYENLIYSSANLILTAERLLKLKGHHYLSCTCLTVKDICCTPSVKRAFAKKFSAGAVDMESFWLGQVSAANNIPFIVVRMVIDTVYDDISVIDRIISHGKLNQLKALSYILTHPACLKEVTDYGRKFRRIRPNLAGYLVDFIEELEQN